MTLVEIGSVPSLSVRDSLQTLERAGIEGVALDPLQSKPPYRPDGGQRVRLAVPAEQVEQARAALAARSAADEERVRPMVAPLRRAFVILILAVVALAALRLAFHLRR